MEQWCSTTPVGQVAHGVGWSLADSGHMACSNLDLLYIAIPAPAVYCACCRCQPQDKQVNVPLPNGGSSLLQHWLELSPKLLKCQLLGGGEAPHALDTVLVMRQL